MMRKRKPNYIRFALFLTVCIAAAWGIGRCSADTHERISPDALNALNGYLLSQSRTDDSTQVTKAPVAQIAPKQLAELKDSLSKQIKADLGREFKRLQTAKIIETRTVVERTVPVHDTVVIRETDTVPAKSFAYTDTWTDLTGLIVGDSAEINYKTAAELRVYTYWKRDGLFKPKHLRAKIRTNNPHLVVTRYRDISVPYERKWHEKPAFRTVAALGLFTAGFFTGASIN